MSALATMTDLLQTPCRTPDRRRLLLAGAAVAGALTAHPVAAQESPVASDAPGSATVHSLPIGENTEAETRADPLAVPFVISVDGELVAASGAPQGPSETAAPDAPPPARTVDRQRQADVALDAVDIQMKFDGLTADPILNVSAAPPQQAYRGGEEVRFLTSANYPAFIERAEILIFAEDDPTRPFAAIPAEINGEASWTVPEDGEEEFSYVLRVYDAEGRYDETLPLAISRTDRDRSNPPETEPATFDANVDRTASRNIPVQGGAVTVHGGNVPQGHAVRAFGEAVALDPNQAFVVQRILPPGTHEVDVAVTDESGADGLMFGRDITIPDDDWFYVGLADLTIGTRSGDDMIETVRPDEYDTYGKGRLGFYLKGKIKGEYLLTAAADTGEEDLDNLFRDLDGQDPRHILRRLDPDDYYPVYGDDSSFLEDAPTNGKFYVRVERGDSQVVWGNVNTQITGTEFLRADRAVYGASAVYRSENVTSFGERRTAITAYAAQPETLPFREEFLGTGGSAYFMRRQNIIEGSETVIVETRDAVTGRVIGRQFLAYGADYSFDYMQGVLILRRPLSSMTAAQGPVRDGALGGDRQYLTVQYEFEPVATDIDGYAYGGRVQHWLNDSLRVGVTGMEESTGLADQQAWGGDVTLRRSDRTFLTAEIATSKGPGFSHSGSSDGGLTWGDEVPAGEAGREATGWRIEGQLDPEEIGAGTTGLLGGYYEQKERGFSTLFDQAAVDRRIWGLHADVALTARLSAALSYDDLDDDSGQSRREGASSLSWQFDDYWKASVGLTYRRLVSPNAIGAGKSGYDGSGLDAGVRLDHRIDDDRLIYAFGQATIDRSRDIDRNDRIGMGADVQFTDTISGTGELSYGTHGMGALASLDYAPSADEQYYVGYRLDPDRAFDLYRGDDLFGSDKGAIVGGLRRRLGEDLSAFTESTYDMFGVRRSLSQAYGVVYTPDNKWTVEGGLEVGRLRDDTVVGGVEQEDFDRYAPSLSVVYSNEEAGVDAHVRSEVRVERSDRGTRDQDTYLMVAGLGWRTSPDWRLITHLDAVLSESRSSQTSYGDTNYLEASTGFAYRPIDNDRLNALFKYAWLYDLPGNNQLISAATGDLFAPAQRSHILSADAIYDVTPWLSVGGKYGVRYGEVRNRTSDGDGTGFEAEWSDSSAHLGILRADLHFVKKWDALLEARVLHSPQADTTDLGALAAIYRHVGDNLRIGVGYNFGRFSDDLRDLTLDDEGVFLNLVGTF